MPLNVGSGSGWSVHPAAQWRPVCAAGPASGPHFVRSKLARWFVPESAVQMTPLRSTSMPRGMKPSSPLASTFQRSDGTSNTSALQLAGGSSPSTSRTMRPG